MVIYSIDMTISVTKFKARCLSLLRQVERKSAAIEITRRGKVVARVVPALAHCASLQKPWERLQGTGVLVAKPEEAFLSESDFDAAT